MSKLMIVESPAKCKKIEGYLGSGWIVKASFGHIRDLPEKEMGVSFPDYRPQYQLNQRSRKNISELKRLSQSADEVYLATDPDREGESISWHLKEVLGLREYKRVSFNEVTQKALEKSLRDASTIDFNLVKAQEGRRVLDRLVGYSVTPAISNLYGRWITAGRVQSVAVRIVVEREIAIRDFVSTDYFDVYIQFDSNTELPWRAKWLSEPYLGENQEYMQDESLVNEVANIRDVIVTQFSEKKQTRNPPAPFITSTLQQAASSQLKFSPKLCMELSQKLFDEGLITYHRTDNPNPSEDGFNAIVQWLDNNGYADNRVEKPNQWKAKAGAQEGHEAMRPTDINLLPAKVAQSYDSDLSRLYDLIWYRTVASQMKASVYHVKQALMESLKSVGGQLAIFKAQGRTLIYPGWLALKSGDKSSVDSSEHDRVDNQVIPNMTENQELSADSSVVLDKKTKPPGRFTEASLVKKLEDEGIGRPSTYASILDNIHRRGYVSIKKRMLHATETGFTIYNLLNGRFAFMELSYTRDIETDLDALAHGKKQYREVMDMAYQQLLSELEKIEDVKIEGVDVHLCPKCESPLRLIKNEFWGCTRYPECRYTAANIDGQPVDNKSEPKTIDKSHPCECGNGYYQKRKGSNGNFWGCSNYPDCKNTRPDESGVPGKQVDRKSNNSITDIDCPACHSGKLTIRKARSGKNKDRQFYGCSLYPDCNYFKWLDDRG